MLLRLTTVLGAGLYCTMVILGTEQPGAMTAEAAATETTRPVSARSTFSPATEPLLMTAAYTESDAPEVTATPAVQVSEVTPTAASFTPDPAPAAEPADDSGLLRIGALDAPTGALQAEANAMAEQESGIDVVEVTGSVVNLRAGPSTGNDVVTKLRRGARAELIETADNGWMRIRDLGSGAEGFMSGDFLSRVTPG